MPVRGSCDQPAMYLRAMGLRFFKICHSHGAKLSKIVEATMPVNPYDDDWTQVSLLWPNEKDDLDIVRASLTRRKVIVTEAL